MGAVLVPAAPAQAAVTVLDFDYGPADTPCDFADVNPLREKYAGFGIHFTGPNDTDGGAILNTCSNFGVQPHSGARFVAFSDGSTMANGGNPYGRITISFDSLKRVVQVYVSQGGFAVGDMTFVFVAKRAGRVVQKAFGGTATSDWMLLRLNAPHGISQVTLRVHDPNNAWLADDLGIRTL